jgi:C-terminal processing protease CtpA/Prc
VGAALSVNGDGEVIFSQMVPGMPAANSGAISIGDALVSLNPKP